MPLKLQQHSSAATSVEGKPVSDAGLPAGAAPDLVQAGPLPQRAAPRHPRCCRWCWNPHSWTQLRAAPAAHWLTLVGQIERLGLKA